MRHGEIEFLLQVLILYADEFVVVVDIACIIVGVLHVGFDGPSVEEFILPCGLQKRVAVPKSFAIAPDIIHNRTRYPTLGVVVIELQFPEACIAIVMIKSCFHANGIDVTILTDSSRVICHFARRCHTAITERILAIRGHQLRVGSNRHRFTQANIKQQTRIDECETACPHLRFDIKRLAFFKSWTTRSKIDTTRSTKLAGRLPDIRFLTIIELNLLDILQRVFTQVYLAILRITQLHTIIENAHVIGAH